MFDLGSFTRTAAAMVSANDARGFADRAFALVAENDRAAADFAAWESEVDGRMAS